MSKTAVAVTADQIIAEVRRLAAEQPDFIYQRPRHSSSCLYKHEDGTPGCIFGQALENLGVEVTHFTFGSIDTLLTSRGISYTEEQRGWMGQAQGDQDSGSTWAEAIENADRWYPNV